MSSQGDENQATSEHKPDCLQHEGGTEGHEVGHEGVSSLAMEMELLLQQQSGLC